MPPHGGFFVQNDDTRFFSRLLTDTFKLYHKNSTFLIRNPLHFKFFLKFDLLVEIFRLSVHSTTKTKRYFLYRQLLR